MIKDYFPEFVACIYGIIFLICVIRGVYLVLFGQEKKSLLGYIFLILVGCMITEYIMIDILFNFSDFRQYDLYRFFSIREQIEFELKQEFANIFLEKLLIINYFVRVWFKNKEKILINTINNAE